MTFDLNTILTLFGLAVSVLGLCFAFVKWNSSQIHGRISSVKADLEKKIENVEDNANSRINGAFETIKEMMREIREDVRWLMQNSNDRNKP